MESKLIKQATSQSVTRLVLERPEWVPVLEAAVSVAESVEDHGGEFAGAWVVNELAQRGSTRWVPNLRLLVTYGLLEKSGPSTRGGRRAYYRMPDRLGVLEALEAIKEATPAKKLSFVGAAASSQPPADAARRSADAPYEPRSWR